MPDYLDLHYVDQIRLKLFPDRGGIAGAIHKSRENEKAILIPHAAGIASLHGGNLPAKKYLLRQQFIANIRGRKQSFLDRRRIRGRLRLGERNDTGGSKPCRQQKTPSAKTYSDSPFVDGRLL